MMVIMVIMVLGDCCTPETPCKLGEGDCQQDVDCRDDLVTCTLYCILCTLYLQHIICLLFTVLIEGTQLILL